MSALIRKAARTLGYDVVRYQPSSRASLPSDLQPDDKMVLEQIALYTMTSLERQIALIQAARYIVRRGVQGCFVECGVWKGGSSMACALALIQEGDINRDLYLYDTFEGMTPPLDLDRTAAGQTAKALLDRDSDKDGEIWCMADMNEVRKNLLSTGYPADKLNLVKGPVEETIPANLPSGPIALLRLDTDWYQSTKHELVHLFPLLCKGGILIIDDYGHWQGARTAVDEYLAELPVTYLLQRIDYTGRLLIKQ